MLTVITAITPPKTTTRRECHLAVEGSDPICVLNRVENHLCQRPWVLWPVGVQARVFTKEGLHHAGCVWIMECIQLTPWQVLSGLFEILKDSDLNRLRSQTLRNPKPRPVNNPKHRISFFNTDFRAGQRLRNSRPYTLNPTHRKPYALAIRIKMQRSPPGQRKGTSARAGLSL